MSPSHVQRVRAFRLHFNRINMQRGNPNVWTVHVSGQCIPTRQVVVKVPLVTQYNPKGRQPRALLVGRGVVKVLKGRVIISDVKV